MYKFTISKSRSKDWVYLSAVKSKQETIYLALRILFFIYDHFLFQ